jgi:hypothetical protein
MRFGSSPTLGTVLAPSPHPDLDEEEWSAMRQRLIDDSRAFDDDTFPHF